MIKPGRELDALVAERVMGWKDITSGYEDRDLVGTITLDDGRPFIKFATVHKYSTSIGAAWEVAEKIMIESIIKTENGYIANVVGNFCTGKLAWPRVNEYYEISLYEDSIVIGETAPHAICLAALKAVGYNF